MTHSSHVKLQQTKDVILKSSKTGMMRKERIKQLGQVDYSSSAMHKLTDTSQVHATEI